MSAADSTEPGRRSAERPPRPITGFHQDELRDWVAELACGHFQHVRHNPPWQERPWVVTAAGRLEAIGEELCCAKCLEGAPPDSVGMSD